MKRAASFERRPVDSRLPISSGSPPDGLQRDEDQDGASDAAAE
jgi:hypothetical protein